MCGIYGYIGRPTKRTRHVLHMLGLLNETRGADSAGVAIIDQYGCDTFKQACPSSELWKRKDLYKSLVQHSDDFMTVIGHTRAATRGAVNYDNAHPYNIGDYIFAHNGVIYNFDKLQSMLGTKHQVDSQIIGELLTRNLPGKVFEKMLDGWYAVPYVNLQNPYQLNIARHISPLAFAMRTDKRGLYFSSEASHLAQAIAWAEEIAPINRSGDNKFYSFIYSRGKVNIHKESLRVKTDDLYAYIPAPKTIYTPSVHHEYDDDDYYLRHSITETGYWTTTPTGISVWHPYINGYYIVLASGHKTWVANTPEGVSHPEGNTQVSEAIKAMDDILADGVDADEMDDIALTIAEQRQQNYDDDKLMDEMDDAEDDKDMPPDNDGVVIHEGQVLDLQKRIPIGKRYSNGHPIIIH